MQCLCHWLMTEMPFQQGNSSSVNETSLLRVKSVHSEKMRTKIIKPLTALCPVYTMSCISWKILETRKNNL